MEFKYRYFDPAQAGGKVLDGGVVAFQAGEAPEDLYLYTERVILALNVALATNRPLLIAGEPGCGKSRLARNAAAVLGWTYYEKVITSRTQAADLLYTFDALRRLNAATTPGVELRPDRHYVEPGILWWAFDASTATHRGRGELLDELDQAKDPALVTGDSGNVVVLLDEIDKADPDVPNDLLEPLDRKALRDYDDNLIQADTRDVLMILTTNGERDLPPAVMRRCVLLAIDPPTKSWLVEIADRRYGTDSRSLHRSIAEEMAWLREQAKNRNLRPPGTGEYLDALAACRSLGLDRDHGMWREVAKAVLWKQDDQALPVQDSDES